MSLIKKLFGRSPASAAPAVESSTFHESETTTEQGSRNAPRRELVQVVLRDTMRRHGIPSAWIDCRILSVVSRSNATGMHVQLVVRDGEDRLLAYVPAFQSSFLQGIEKFEPKCSEWLLSLSWQFPGISSSTPAMPDPAAWEPPHGTTSEEDEIMKDVQALFAIRDAAINAPQPLKEATDFEETRPVAGDSR